VLQHISHITRSAIHKTHSYTKETKKKTRSYVKDKLCKFALLSSCVFSPIFVCFHLKWTSTYPTRTISPTWKKRNDLSNQKHSRDTLYKGQDTSIWWLTRTEWISSKKGTSSEINVCTSSLRVS